MPDGSRSGWRVAAVFFACVASATLGAQESAAVAITGVSTGSRIRVATRDAQPFVGTLVRRAADTLVVELPSNALLALPQTRVTRLDVSGGIRRRTWQGAGIGFLVGAGAGTAIALATYHRATCIDSAIAQGLVCPFLDDVSHQTTVIVDASLIGAAGTVVGALIGHVGRETWIPVSLSSAHGVELQLGLRQGGASLGAALWP
jgi:hypothetical protein